MKINFNTLRKLSPRQLMKLASLCAGTALLLLVAIFLSGGVGDMRGHFSFFNPYSQIASILSCAVTNDCSDYGETISGDISVSPTNPALNSYATVNASFTYWTNTGGWHGACTSYFWGGRYGSGPDFTNGTNALGSLYSPVPGYGSLMSNSYTVGPLDQYATYTAGIFCQGVVTTTHDTVYAYATVAAAPASCTFNGATVASGASVTAYQTSSVLYGQTCTSEQRTCTNGALSGSYAYSSCSVGADPCPNNGGVGSWDTIANSYVITGGGSGPITTPWGRICATNYTGNIYFVPVKTQAEWNSFVAATARLSVGYFGY